MTGKDAACEQYPNCVMLTSKDMKQSIAFYRDTLGFELKECWPDAENAAYANLVLDNQSIMLGAAPDPDKAKEMGCSASDLEYWKKQGEAFRKGPAGVGVYVYVAVKDVDAAHKAVKAKGGKPMSDPVTQFYGLRDFRIADPTGYVLHLYSPVKMTQCQSCGMPLKDSKPGQMYCDYCSTPAGTLKPYEQVLEGTTSGYFEAQMKMPRKDAEKAAREHLSKQPAWSTKKG